MREKPLLQVKNVMLQYGEQIVVDNVSLDLKHGERLAILGANGCGKTTLLRLLSGECKPDSGSVLLNGRNISNFTAVERAQKIAVLPQHSLGDINLLVEEFIALGRYPHHNKWAFSNGHEKDEYIIAKVMETNNISHLRYRPLSQLSGGEQQMVCLAKVMAQAPELLLLDEPNTYLDLQHQANLFSMLREWQEGRELAIAIVLHDPNLAALNCHSLCMIKKGKLLKKDNPLKIMNAAMLEEVYGLKTTIIYHPDEGTPQFLHNRNVK